MSSADTCLPIRTTCGLSVRKSKIQFLLFCRASASACCSRESSLSGAGLASSPRSVLALGTPACSGQKV
ncbi:unnamed protein product [Merluccius merluccius]